MKVDDILDILTCFFNEITPKLKINDFSITSHYSNPVIRVLGEKNVPNKSLDNLHKKSGIYIFTSDKDEIIYIGKAEDNSLHQEIWGKIKTPKEYDQNKKRWMFPNAFKWEKTEDIKLGKAKIAIFIFSHKELVSLAEVYLQTLFYYENNHNLPVLNDRIG
jgi:hypothetical protein